MTPLRILQLINHLGSGGAQAILSDIVTLANCPHHEFTVAYLYGNSMYTERLLEAGARVVYLGSKQAKLSRFHTFVPLKLPWLHHRVRPQIVHLHTRTLLVLHELLLRQLFPSQRLLITIHGSNFQAEPYWNRCLRWLLPRCDIIVTEYAGGINDMISFGIPRDRLFHIPFGASVHPVDEDTVEQVRTQVGLGGGEPLLLSVARLAPDRHIDRFIEAMPDVLESFPQAKLVLVGDGRAENVLRTLVDTLGLQDSVLFLGRQSDPVPFYYACDVYLTLTRGEDVGIAGWQAMLCGKPVIALENPGHIYLPEEKYTHILRVNYPHQLADAITSVLADRALARELAAAGKEFAERYHSSKAMVDQYTALYRQMAGCT
jgi:glycosyltransferase involved in cell wall biosynthesis